MEDQEQEWLARARTGDRQAFSELVARYWPRVQRWLYRLVRRCDVADDLTQEVFLKAWSALSAFAGDHFRPWLFCIARHSLADHLRRASNRKFAPLPEAQPSRGPGPEAEVAGHEIQALLERACAALPLPYRAALLLWTQEQLSHAEIAQALGITEVTARWRVCKARQMLLKRLKPYLHGNEP